MTSEGPHHPGHEPDEVAPGAGGSAPFGGQPTAAHRPAGAPDLGWAPPPPVEHRQQGGWDAGQAPEQPAWGPGQMPDHGRAEQPAWDPPAESARPVRASASVPVPGAEAPPSWDTPPPAAPPLWPGGGGPDLPQRTGVPTVEPWAPGEAWGSTAASGAEPAGTPAADPAPAAANWGPPPAAPVSGGNGPQPAEPWGAAPQAGGWEPANPADNRPDPNGWQHASPAGDAPGANAWEPAAPTGHAPGPEAWEAAPRAEHNPMYQPAPSPGFSPAGAVPLPPQEQRVPGASLAASPPVDYQAPMDYQPPAGYQAPAEFSPPQQRSPVEDGYPGGTGFGGADDHRAGGAGWDAEAYPPQEPQAPVIPQPRTSPESSASARVAVPQPSVPADADVSAASGSVTASASVPMASRVMPPTDMAIRPPQPPQPRVYGRPTRPEPEPEEVELPDEPADHRPGSGPVAPHGGYDEHGYDQGDYQQGGYDQSGYDQGDYQQSGYDQGGYNREAPPSGYDPPASASASARVAPPVAPIPDFSQGHAPFGDLVGNRPVNGVKPNTPAAMGAARTGGPERFGDSAAPVSGGGHIDGGFVAYQGHGGPDATALAPVVPSPAARPADPTPGGFDSGPEPWGSTTEAWNPAGDPGQGRFDNFKPEVEPKAEEPAPTPKVRNGRVLLAVLTAAVLLLVVPLGALWLLGKTGGSDTPAFDPAVNSCVKQSGDSAVAANCSDPGTFSIVSKVDAKEKCADKSQPHVVLPGTGPTRVLCLKPVAPR